MTCPTSVHQLRDQSHIWLFGTRLQNWLYPPVFLPVIFSPWYTQKLFVVCFCFFLPAMSLQRHHFLFYFVTLSWAVHCPYLRFRMFFLISPHSCSLPLPFCSGWRLKHLNPSFTTKVSRKILGWLRSHLDKLFNTSLSTAYFMKNFILKKVNLLIRDLLFKLMAP